MLIASSWDGPLLGDRGGDASSLARSTPPARSSLTLDQPQIFEYLSKQNEILFLPVDWWFLIEVLDPSATVEFTDGWSDHEGRTGGGAS